MQANIVPVQVFPSTATVLVLRAGGLGPPPAYYYQLCKVTPVVPPGGTDPVDSLEVLKDGNFNMTDAQWQNWTDSVDDDQPALFDLGPDQ